MSFNFLVSVITPVYNCERYLDDTVRSVLAQTYQHWELLLIIDVKNSDHSLEKALAWGQQDSRIKILQSPENLGVANNRNIGIKSANGDLIAFLDADDLWLPQKLERQIDFMVKKNADFCSHTYQQIQEDGSLLPIIRRCRENATREDLLKSNDIGCLTVMIKSSLIKQFSFKSNQAHEDYVLWLEILEKTSIAYGLDEVLGYYRVLPQSRSADKKKAALDRWHIYRRVLRLSLTSSIYYFCHYALMALHQRRRPY